MMIKPSVEKIFTFLKRVVTYQIVSAFLLLNIFFTSIGAVSLLILLDQMIFELVWMSDMVMIMCYAMLLANMVVFILMKIGMLTGVVEIKV